MPITLKKKIDLILSEVGLEEDAYEINSNIPGEDVDIIREGYFRQEEDFVQRKLVVEHPNLFYRYMWPSYESIFPPRYDRISNVMMQKVCISYRYQFAAIMLKEEKFLKEKAGVFIGECKEKLLAMGYKEGDLIRLKVAAESNADDLLDLQEEIDALEVCARE